MNKIVFEKGYTCNFCVGCGMMATKRIYEEGFFVNHRQNMFYSHVCDSEICLNIAILKFMGENE